MIEPTTVFWFMVLAFLAGIGYGLVLMFVINLQDND